MQAGGRRFDPDQLHQSGDRGQATGNSRASASTIDCGHEQRSTLLIPSQSQALKAVGSLTIREGKAFAQVRCEPRADEGLRVVSCFLRRHKRRCGSWRKHARKRGAPGRPGLTVMGSSDEVHVMDALAITGDEGRGSLRKAAGSRQTGFDPQISEWGNPARKGYSPLNT